MRKMDLFEYNRSLQGGKEAPLAARMRPSCLEDFVGQEHIVGKGKLLYRAIQSDRLSSGENHCQYNEKQILPD